MNIQSIFKASDFMMPSTGEQIHAVVMESQHSVILAWHVKTGQAIAPPTHPTVQDTWTILPGRGRNQTNELGHCIDIEPGDIVVALQNKFMVSLAQVKNHCNSFQWSLPLNQAMFQ